MLPLLKKCLAEFLGTFAIVFVGCGAIVSDQISDGKITHLGISLCFGVVVMAMIYAMGHISGAHFNPAVTLAFALGRHFPIKEILPYWFSQCLGAIMASFVHKNTLASWFYQNGKIMEYGVTQPFDGLWWTAMVWEMLLTFFLMMVIMAVATDYRAVGSAAGIAIGGTVLFEAIFAGPICGASMNPARSLGPVVLSGDSQYFSAYVIGPILGACCAALLYSFMRCEDKTVQEVKGCC